MSRLSRSAISFRPGLLAVIAIVATLLSGCFIAGGGDGPIVFVSDADGDREIYLLDPETGESSRLTNNSSADEEPRWSHDGKHIAFVSQESGDQEINLIDKEGEQRRRLTDSPGSDASPRWSPVEDRLAYVSQSQEDGDAGTDIYSLLIKDREINRVTFEPVSEELGDWSPDGEWLVFFNRGAETDRGLWLRNPEGVNVVQLTEDEDTQPRWSPDGKYIAFVRQQGDAKAIFLARRAKDDSWEEGIDTTELSHGSYDDYSPVWHPDSKVIAFVSTRDGNPEIYTMQADGSDQRRLTRNEVDDISPVWSPSGKRLAFVTHLYGSADILVMNTDGTEQRRLTKGGAEDFSPDW